MNNPPVAMMASQSPEMVARNLLRQSVAFRQGDHTRVWTRVIRVGSTITPRTRWAMVEAVHFEVGEVPTNYTLAPSLPEDAAEPATALLSRAARSLSPGNADNPLITLGARAQWDHLLERLESDEAGNEPAEPPAAPIKLGYVSRTFFGRTDFEIFDTAREHQHNVLLIGDTGGGKTLSAYAWAEARGREVYAIPGYAALDATQLFGKFVPEEAGAFRWVDGPATKVVRNGGVLILDELNHIPAKVATVLFPLLDGRRVITLLDHLGEVVEAHEDLLIIATMNPDYRGTVALNPALRNRFAIQIEWDYQTSVENQLVPSASLVSVATRLREQRAQGDLETPVGTNMLLELAELEQYLGWDFAAGNFASHFAPEEKAAVQHVFAALEHNIREELRK